MKLTEKDFIEFELNGKVYWKLDCTNEMVQQILQNQEKANKCSNEECNGILKWSTRFRKSLQENNQLKEELLKSAVTLLDNTSAAGGKLKSKLEKIKKLVKEREYDYEEIAFTTFMINLKKLLEEENKK